MAIYCQKSKDRSTTLEISKGSIWKKHNAELLKPYTEKSTDQEAEENDVVADEKPAKKNLKNVPDGKSSNQTQKYWENLI